MFGFSQFFANDESIERIINLYSQGRPISEIVSQTGKSQAEIYRLLRKNNIHPNRLKSKHHMVFNLAGLGWSIKQIAEITGYSQRNVRYVLGGKQ